MSSTLRAKPNRRIEPKNRQQRSTDRLFIVVITALTLVILEALVTLNWLSNQPRSTPAAPVDANALLPLAPPVAPIRGVHDMQNMPQLPAQGRPLAADVPQPNVDLPLVRWDWGTIPRRPVVSQTFPIQNQGTQPLLITNVVTSCGCTSADLSASLIPAGQRADLVVLFDPDFHDTSGPVTRLVWLETNDPDMPVVELRMDAVVRP